MTDEEEIALAKRLPKGSRRALLAMTTAPTLPGKATFNANAAHNLRWTARTYGGLAAHVGRGGRWAYHLTPLGERIRDRLATQGTEAQRAETVEQGSVHDGPVREANAPNASPNLKGTTP